MAGETLTTGLPGIVQSIRARSYGYIAKTGVMKTLVTPLTGTGNSFVEPYFDPTQTPGTTTALQTVAEGTDITALSSVTATRRTYTATEYQLMSFMTDKSRQQSLESVKTFHSDVHGYQHAANLEGKLLACLASATSSIVATSSTGLTWAKVAASRSLLEKQVLAAPKPYALVISPEQFYWFAAAMVTNANYGPTGTLADSIQQKYAVASLVGGVNVFQSSYFTATSGYQKAGMFSKPAIGLFIPTGSDYTMETQRDASKRGDEIVSTFNFGARIRIPGYAVGVHAKSTTPS